ncbi:MAG: tetratricopeptide repeat protein [Deltaproteobacteria bacterium]|nr:tetratricopeptide repeat protein [Deltaproteobacteria bacterium]
MLQEATKAYEKALKLNPTNAKGLSALGYLYGTIGENLEIAIVLCKESVKFDPDNGLYRRRLGKLYLQNEDHENALEQFKKAAELGEDCTDLIQETENHMTGPADVDAAVDVDVVVDSEQ